MGTAKGMQSSVGVESVLAMRADSTLRELGERRDQLPPELAAGTGLPGIHWDDKSIPWGGNAVSKFGVGLEMPLTLRKKTPAWCFQWLEAQFVGLSLILETRQWDES